MEIKQFKGKKGLKVDELLYQYKDLGHQAKKLGEAADIIVEMIKDKECKVFLGLAGALVPGGMRLILKDMIERGELRFFFEAPNYDKLKLIFKNTPAEKIKHNLELARKALENLDENNFETEEIKNTLMLIADNLGSRGELLHPVRYALSGADKSPDPFIIASILGKNETLSRLQKAI